MMKARPAPRIVLCDVTVIDGAYCLGLIWGIGALLGDYFVFRTKDKSVLALIRERLNSKSQIYPVGKTYALKIAAGADVKKLTEWLTSMGWTRRQAQERKYPEAKGINHRGFIAGWARLHSSADTVRTKWGENPRVRIYGNYALMQTMSEIIASQTDIPIMKPQKAPNEITKILYYQGKSAFLLQEWLRGR